MASPITPNSSITIYRGFKDTEVYTSSPFVGKLEARLRFGGVEYRSDGGSPAQAPRGKLPYIAVSDKKGAEIPSSSASSSSPTMLSDTSLIVDRFVQDGLLDELNGKLSATDKAQDLAIRALLEDKVYFYQVYEKWFENYYAMRGSILAPLPYPVQVIVGLIIYRKIVQTLYGQGTSRFSAKEIDAFKLEGWESVNALLVAAKDKMPTGKGAGSEDEVFWLLGGAEPTEADTTLFGFITAGLSCPASPKTRALIKSYPTVEDYASRIHGRYFPEYIKWT